jgi:two-component system cell cycle response regulator DivK
MTSTHKILIVEESKDISIITSKIFQFQGWQVINASSGEEVLSFLISNTVDVILMDINLPSMSGVECCGEIRKLKDKMKSNIPIIAITGNTLNWNLLQYQSKGFTYFYQKPVKFEILIDKIKSILGINK